MLGLLWAHRPSSSSSPSPVPPSPEKATESSSSSSLPSRASTVCDSAEAVSSPVGERLSESSSLRSESEGAYRSSPVQDEVIMVVSPHSDDPGAGRSKPGPLGPQQKPSAEFMTKALAAQFPSFAQVHGGGGRGAAKNRRGLRHRLGSAPMGGRAAWADPKTRDFGPKHCERDEDAKRALSAPQPMYPRKGGSSKASAKMFCPSPPGGE